MVPRTPETTGTGVGGIDLSLPSYDESPYGTGSARLIPSSRHFNAAYVPGNPTLVVTYNGDGTVATTTENGVLTTFTYKAKTTLRYVPSSPS